jgi:hypothetical protein
MNELKELQLEILNKINFERENYGNVNPELLWLYDQLIAFMEKK